MKRPNWRDERIARRDLYRDHEAFLTQHVSTPFMKKRTGLGNARTLDTSRAFLPPTLAFVFLEIRPTFHG
jgi:hypothetical protein